jgi:hypothetical protein
MTADDQTMEKATITPVESVVVCLASGLVAGWQAVNSAIQRELVMYKCPPSCHGRMGGCSTHRPPIQNGHLHTILVQDWLHW